MLKLPSLRDASTEIYSLQEHTCKTDLFLLAHSSRLMSSVSSLKLLQFALLEHLH